MKKTGKSICRLTILFLSLVLLLAPRGVALADTMPKDDSAHIVATGDIMCIAGQLSAAQVSGGWNFDYVFADIAPVLQGADYAIGNLETVVAGKEAGVTAFNQPGSPVINAPDEFADAVQKAGFDMVAMANNHCFDKGEEGVIKTLNAMAKRGVFRSGTYAYDSERPYMPIVSIKGMRVAFLSYTKPINRGRSLLEGELSYMVNLLTPEKVEQDIATVKERGADFVVVYTHWGKENTSELTAFQTETAQAIADAGADVIIGSHPHVVQGVEYLDGPDGKKVLVCYSLGNLVSSMGKVPENRDSFLLHLEICRDEKGDVILKNADYMCTSTGERKGKRFAIRCSRASGFDQSADRTVKTLGNAIPEVTKFDFME